MNDPITWQVSYSVGIQVIDEQHQHLLTIINALNRDLETKTGDIDIVEFFNEVVSYGEYHFQTEETYFLHYPYPKREEHLLAHQQYKETLSNLIATQEVNSRKKAEQLLDFLEKWWVEHITGIDQTLRGLTTTTSESKENQ